MAGSLLEFHAHNNLIVLNELSEVSDILYYKGKKISSLDVSNEPNNAIETKSDGIYVNGKLLCTKEEKELLAKFSIDESGGLLYNGNKIQTEVKISSDAGNAIQQKQDGLYVEDKSEDIAAVRGDVDGILDDIRKGNTFLGVDIDWITLRTTGTQHQIVNTYLVPDEYYGNMVFKDNIVTLNPNRTYMITATLRIDGGSQLCYTIQDIDTLECFGSGFANASQYMTNYGEQCLMCVIPTENMERKISFHVFDSVNEPTYQGLNIVITEIGRALELPHEITSLDIEEAIRDTLRILDAVDRSIEELNQEE